MRAHPLESDVLFTLGLAFVLVLLPQLISGDELMTALSLALIAPLSWRRTSPAVMAAGIILASGAQLAFYHTLLLGDVAAVIGLYSLAAYGPEWARRIGLPIGLVGALTAGLRYYELPLSYTPLLAGFIMTLVLATWSLGMLRRLGLLEEERLTERARLLERERDQEGRLAATAERARIAREMHDVVAHSLSVTISQADGGRYAARTDPQAAIAALETISATGRQALADMRVLLGVLRQDEGRQLAPQPDTDTIPDLVEQVRSGGLEVTLEITGRAQKLPSGPALAAYRIVQESLTNVLKHAGPASQAWVRLNWLSTALEVSILDDGRGAGAVSGHADGQGVRGMHERAILHGGTLQVGPRPGGGFAVEAVLPYGGSR